MKWTDAQHYCREKYSDLATFTSKEDINRVSRPVIASTMTWIGLRDDPRSWQGVMGNDVNSWRWSATDEFSKTGFQNWHSKEPNNDDADYCVRMNSDGTWKDVPCLDLNRFVCYTGKMRLF